MSQNFWSQYRAKGGAIDVSIASWWKRVTTSITCVRRQSKCVRTSGLSTELEDGQ